MLNFYYLHYKNNKTTAHFLPKWYNANFLFAVAIFTLFLPTFVIIEEKIIFHPLRPNTEINLQKCSFLEICHLLFVETQEIWEKSHPNPLHTLIYNAGTWINLGNLLWTHIQALRSGLFSKTWESSKYLAFQQRFFS